MKQAMLKISGRVQGVFFRAETQEKALSLGLTGWVRNNDDATVEVCAQGDEASLARFIKWCEKGPTGARVDKIEKTWQEPTPSLTDFKIIY
ncbi:acylphosphatase [Candidatus Peregrinibacteria bacterium]|nr:acylphosphatase [Candidatus Peregrinibacteria bacterium]